MTRELKYSQAILEGTRQCMEVDARIYVMGLGVPDPKGVFGTTLGLQEQFGEKRVMDMPTSENAMTGVAIGSAVVGMRPVLTHQRVDFALLSLDQIINNAAKWHYMFGEKMRVPLVIRLVIGRGWGQGPQHSQSLQSIFGHIPGLKVVMPTTPYDAKGLLVSAIEDDNPVIYLEHRWLHNTHGPVPEEIYRIPIGKARTIRNGNDVTIVATSYMVLEALRAADILAKHGIDAEVVDLRSIRPLDEEEILASVRKTGRLVAVDADWKMMGVASEVLALATEKAFDDLKCSPKRIALPDMPAPTSWHLSNHYYPRTVHIVNAVRSMMDLPEQTEEEFGISHDKPLDVPDAAFTGPF